MRRRKVGGRRIRRVHRKRRGGAIAGHKLSNLFLIKQALKNLHSHVKEGKYVSHLLKAQKHPFAQALGHTAERLGYGRRRKRGGRRVRRRRHRGGDFLGIGNFFRKTVPNAFRSAHDFVKKHKIVSRGLALIPHPGAKVGSYAAEKLGYGRRKYHHRGGARRVTRLTGFGRRKHGGALSGRLFLV